MNRLSFCSISLSCLLIPATLLAQGSKPVIAGPIKHGASMFGSRVSLDDDFVSGLAQGSIFVAVGSDLGPAELVHGTIPYPAQLPSEPGGTQVSFRSIESGQTFQAYLIHSSATQVAGIIPSDVPLGFAEVRVAYNGMESDPTLVGISRAWAGLFTVSQDGRGLGVVQNYESPASQPLNSLSRPATPGQYLTLWGTGLGATDGPDNAPSEARNVGENVIVQFGSGPDGVVWVPAEYAGRSPEFPGVDQINVRIPDDGSVELGCYTQVTVDAGIQSGPSVGVAISDTPGECDHPWSLSAQRQAALDQGELATFFHLYVNSADANARGANADATGVALNLGYSQRPGPSLEPACSLGQFVTFGGGDPGTTPYFEPLPPGLSVADLGQLRLVGPDLRSVLLERNPYDAIAFRATSDLADDFFIPGEWTLRSSGGKDVPSFETAFRVPPLPEFDLPASVSASTDLEFAWDADLYQPGEQGDLPQDLHGG